MSQEPIIPSNSLFGNSINPQMVISLTNPPENDSELERFVDPIPKKDAKIERGQMRTIF